MCVFKYHAFIFFMRPPRWRYGTLPMYTVVSISSYTSKTLSFYTMSGLSPALYLAIWQYSLYNISCLSIVPVSSSSMYSILDHSVLYPACLCFYIHNFCSVYSLCTFSLYRLSTFLMPGRSQYVQSVNFMSMHIFAVNIFQIQSV
jgi:hypothetical protein